MSVPFGSDSLREMLGFQGRDGVLFCINSMTQRTHRRLEMKTVRKTITLTDKQDEWVKAQIASGDYTNDSEYFRDLVRRDQEQNAKFRALKDAIKEGLDSGISERTVVEIWEEAERRYRARNA